MKTVFTSIALVFLIMGCTPAKEATVDRSSVRLKGGGCEIFVEKGVDKDTGQRLLTHLLVQMSPFCEGPRVFQIAKDDDVYKLRYLVKKTPQEGQDDEFLEAMEILGADIRDSVFDGDDLMVELIDKNFTTVKSVEPEKKAVITMGNSSIQITVPTNWTRTWKGDWGLLTSHNNKAHLALVPYSEPNEWVKRLDQIATVLNASKIKWNATKRGNIGIDQLDALMADGTATFGGEPGAIAYATVDAGMPEKVLVVYSLESSVSAATSKQASAIFKSIRAAR